MADGVIPHGDYTAKTERRQEARSQVYIPDIDASDTPCERELVTRYSSTVVNSISATSVRRLLGSHNHPLFHFIYCITQLINILCKMTGQKNGLSPRFQVQ